MGFIGKRAPVLILPLWVVGGRGAGGEILPGNVEGPEDPAGKGRALL